MLKNYIVAVDLGGDVLPRLIPMTEEQAQEVCTMYAVSFVLDGTASVVSTLGPRALVAWSYEDLVEHNSVEED